MTEDASKPIGPSSSPVANRRFEDALRQVLSVSSDRMKELIEEDKARNKRTKVSVSADPDSDVSG